jgi:hypothetical protein
VSNDYCADGFEVKANDNGTYGVVEAATADGDGTEANPYTLEQLGTMTRQAYIEAQNRLNGTMYVTVGNYAYDTNGVLGNGVRDDTTGQIPDHSKLNAYGENGYRVRRTTAPTARALCSSAAPSPAASRVTPASTRSAHPCCWRCPLTPT